MFDLTQKKKKKAKKPKADAAADADGAKEGSAEGAASGDVASSSGAGVFELDPPNYTYTQLLNRVVDSLQQNNPELTDKKRITMKPPQLMRGTNRCVHDCSITGTPIELTQISICLLFLMQLVPRRPCG